MDTCKVLSNHDFLPFFLLNGSLDVNYDYSCSIAETLIVWA